LRVSQRKRRHFLRVKRDVVGLMAEAKFYDRRGRMVKHVMRYLGTAEWVRLQGEQS
jgi:hypothetical protein